MKLTKGLLRLLDWVILMVLPFFLAGLLSLLTWSEYLDIVRHDLFIILYMVWAITGSVIYAIHADDKGKYWFIDN